MADQNDLTINTTLYDEAGNPVDVVLDGSIYRLAVDATATIENNESPTKYQLKTDFDAAGDLLTSSADVVLYSYTGDGVLTFIGVSNATTSNYEVAIEIDGTERFRITMSDLGSALGLTSGNTPIWTETANKNFRFRPYESVGFSTGFRVLARATGANTTVTHVTMFKERIT